MHRASAAVPANVSLGPTAMRVMRVATMLCALLACVGCSLETTFSGQPYLVLAPILDSLFVGDRKSTRLNSSHSQISYAVFCLKKKKKNNRTNFEITYWHKSMSYTPVISTADV